MDAHWFEPIRAYCERTDASFWSEPVNALSNAGFLVAAGAASLKGRGDPAALALAGLIGIVGIGSALFHTYANTWSMLADVVPIGLFILGYFLLAMRRFFRLPPVIAGFATLAFAAFNFGFGPALTAATGLPVAKLTNGSIDYAPAALALFGVGTALRLRGGPAGHSTGAIVLGVGVLFLLSLGFRTADASICETLPLGTHFLWHLLNAGVLYGLVVAAVRHREATDA